MCASCEWEAACELCEEITEACDDVPSRNMEYAEDVQEKVGGIWRWVEENEHVTEKQYDALRSWERTIERIRN